MQIRHLAYSMIFLSATSLGALAATTVQDAANLKAALQPYLGQATDVVVIEPSGDGFNVKLDLTSSLAALNKDGASFSFSPVGFTLTPLGGGKWKFDSNASFKLSGTVPKQLSLTESIDNLKVTGVFDEALGYFESLDASSGPLVFVEELLDAEMNGVKISGKFAGFSQKETGKLNAAGGVDISIDGSYGAIDVDVVSGPAALPVKVSLGQSDFKVSATDLKMRALLDLWKFAVANIKSVKIEDPTALKAMITAALPLFGNISESITVNKIAVQSPMGSGGADKLTIGLGLNGIVKDGMFQEGISVEGLSLPEALVPPFATGLIPKNTSFDFKVSGFNAAAAAAAWLKEADFNKDKPVSAEFEASLLPLLLPQGGVEIEIQNTGLNNATYAFTIDGKGTTNFASMPVLKSMITGKGLDELTALILATPPEMGMQSGAAAITMAKGLGKAGPDGKLIWEIEAKADGKILVNGNDISAMFGAAAQTAPAQPAP